MDEAELHRCKNMSLHYADKLFNEIRRDQEDIGDFFGGELLKAYDSATDQVLNKAKNVRTKIRNL